MARCTAEEARKTREKLLDAAIEVFFVEGVSSPSLTKVAEKAGMSRGAIYGHFRNKTDLFNALCDRMLMPADELARAREQGDGDPLLTLHSWIADVLRKASRPGPYRKLFAILFLRAEAVEEGNGLMERMRADSARVRAHERALLKRAVERGQLPADLDLEAATFFVGASLGGMLRVSLLADVDLTDMADRLADASIHGLRSPSLRSPVEA